MLRFVGKTPYPCKFLLKVSAADEVALVDAVNGADLGTLAAARTLRVIDNREVIHNVNSVVRTVLLTLAASDTAVDTSLSRLGTLRVARALYDDARYVGYDVDYRVRAGARTDAAADTLTGVDACDAVLDGDGIFRTYLYTVTVAEAGVGTELVARVCEICGTAGLMTLEIVLSLGCLAGAVAGDVRNLLDDVSRLESEDLCHTLSGGVTARYAEVRVITLTGCECLCVSVTAVVAAGTAVSTGQTVAYGCLGLIGGNTEEVIGHRKEYCTEDRDGKQNKNGN